MQKVLYVGLDVHKVSISVTVAEDGRNGTVGFIGAVPNTPAALSKLSKRLATPDGEVTSQSWFQNDRGPSMRACAGSLPLDQLVRATLTPQNLHMEEATIANLTTLLQRLEESANLVRDALSRLTEKVVRGTK